MLRHGVSARVELALRRIDMHTIWGRVDGKPARVTDTLIYNELDTPKVLQT